MNTKTLEPDASVVEIEELSVEQSHELFDREARRLLGMSGSDFLKAYRAGLLVEDANRPQITELLYLLPFAEAAE